METFWGWLKRSVIANVFLHSVAAIRRVVHVFIAMVNAAPENPRERRCMAYNQSLGVEFFGFPRDCRSRLGGAIGTSPRVQQGARWLRFDSKVATIRQGAALKERVERIENRSVCSIPRTFACYGPQNSQSLMPSIQLYIRH
jgi:hypothetical protein